MLLERVSNRVADEPFPPLLSSSSSYLVSPFPKLFLLFTFSVPFILLILNLFFSVPGPRFQLSSTVCSVPRPHFQLCLFHSCFSCPVWSILFLFIVCHVPVPYNELPFRLESKYQLGLLRPWSSYHIACPFPHFQLRLFRMTTLFCSVPFPHIQRSLLLSYSSYTSSIIIYTIPIPDILHILFLSES